jgi:hypothetical protein
MPDQSIVSIARELAEALLAASQQSAAHEEPQKKISALERELIEAYRAEITEALEV